MHAPCRAAQVSETCHNFDEVKAYVDANVAEIKDFVAEIAKKCVSWANIWRLATQAATASAAGGHGQIQKDSSTAVRMYRTSALCLACWLGFLLELANSP